MTLRTRLAALVAAALGAVSLVAVVPSGVIDVHSVADRGTHLAAGGHDDVRITTADRRDGSARSFAKLRALLLAVLPGVALAALVHRRRAVLSAFVLPAAATPRSPRDSRAPPLALV